MTASPAFPKPSSLRVVGAGGSAFKGPAPFGASLKDDGAGVLVVLGDVRTPQEVALAVPPGLPKGTLVVLPPTAHKKGFFASLGGRATIPRELRASALLAYGCVGIAAGTDPSSALDLVWGVVD